MKHDEFCENARGLRIAYMPGSEQDCLCASRAYKDNPFEEETQVYQEVGWDVWQRTSDPASDGVSAIKGVQ